MVIHNMSIFISISSRSLKNTCLDSYVMAIDHEEMASVHLSSNCSRLTSPFFFQGHRMKERRELPYCQINP